jgi:hypothetical protein
MTPGVQAAKNSVRVERVFLRQHNINITYCFNMKDDNENEAKSTQTSPNHKLYKFNIFVKFVASFLRTLW